MHGWSSPDNGVSQLNNEEPFIVVDGKMIERGWKPFNGEDRRANANDK